MVILAIKALAFIKRNPVNKALLYRELEKPTIGMAAATISLHRLANKRPPFVFG
ncbi:hypothetical protein [Sodalis glossinidius]|uniref:hypothetical protein n=1 Tax=Sodalis glossinidius TaxID=63612 RepID=UPI000323120A|nr:hypothetical protein [Sodalis glossinidius]